MFMLEKLRDALAKFARGGADKAAVDQLAAEIQKILVQADVDVKLSGQLVERIKKKALAEKIPTGLTRREHVINIVHDEMVSFLGKKKSEPSLKKQKILLCGLFGAGKTTMTVKLARFYQKRGLSVGIVACDVWRPAALEQVQQLGKSVNIEVYGEKESDPLKILKHGLGHFRAKNKDVVIIDSAGRSALDENLRQELKEIAETAQPDEKFLVISGDIGQAAGKQASEFNNVVGLTGVIVTKMDSSAKGGGGP